MGSILLTVSRPFRAVFHRQKKIRKIRDFEIRDFFSHSKKFANLLYGNAIDLSGNIYGSKEEILANTKTLTESSSKMLKMQYTLTRIAADILKKSDDEHNALNSSSVTEFAVSLYVLVRQRTTPATRLHTLWRGPMQVISHSQGEYTLLDLTTNKHSIIHHK